MATNGGGGEDVRSSIVRTILLSLIGSGIGAVFSRVLMFLLPQPPAPRGRRARRAHGRARYVHPVTGDELTQGEWVSWQMQRVIRTWWFLGATQAVTITCWIVGFFFPQVLLWWNLSASDLAIILEGMTTMILIAQNLRDAGVIRRIDRNEQRMDAHITRVEGKLDAVLALTPATPAKRDDKGRFTKPAE